MRLFHLSHTDLDGYGCQMILDNYKENFEEVSFFNANYGVEILARLNEIINCIKNTNYLNSMILITDLNLNLDECNFLENEVKTLRENGFNIELKLLDHHISGKESEAQFSWYYLDIEKSATLITYEYFSNIYAKLTHLEKLIETINAIDLWIENSAYFEFGKVLLRIINVDTKEVSSTLFPNEARNYRLFMLYESLNFIDKENPHILLDENIHLLKKSFLGDGIKNNTLDNLSSHYLVNLLGIKKDEMSVYYKNSKGLLTFCLGNISVIANEFLKKFDDEFDFFMDVGFRGIVGMRANNKVDVSAIAKELFDGGGHLNASGGKIKDFKESHNYAELKHLIEELIKEKTP